ncbi:hypothetical protein [Enterococcus rivorum]|uniref:hypothetical protein n=1 Tax=Enterococcus rivorum TaxID=762845 RepID=UPI00363A9BE8
MKKVWQICTSMLLLQIVSLPFAISVRAQEVDTENKILSTEDSVFFLEGEGSSEQTNSLSSSGSINAKQNIPDTSKSNSNGETIASIPDTMFAQVIADELANGDSNAPLT